MKTLKKYNNDSIYLITDPLEIQILIIELSVPKPNRDLKAPVFQTGVFSNLVVTFVFWDDSREAIIVGNNCSEEKLLIFKADHPNLIKIVNKTIEIADKVIHNVKNKYFDGSGQSYN